MAYSNNFYPATYQQPMSYQQMPQMMSQQAMPQMPAQHNKNIFDFVQGDIGARAYYVPPGSSAFLMDAEDKQFFLKSVDTNGVPMPLRRFSYTEEVETQTSHENRMDTSNFVTKEEFNQLKEQMKKEKRNEQR